MSGQPDYLYMLAVGACVAVVAWAVREVTKLGSVVNGLESRLNDHAKVIDLHAQKFDALSEIKASLAVLTSQVNGYSAPHQPSWAAHPPATHAPASPDLLQLFDLLARAVTKQTT